ncbi:hypothetical protein CBZ_27600 [Cellulomonas biazotea]|uniref:Uncharacterized protein n=1 Tax=Cellulomonas biazotea TaxID=1709 RepID=A0A402DUB6_9CELL|nr:hypothetical protein CBZ_27600 [Cellulomonas biazotea]
MTFAGWSTLTSAIEVGGYAATVETGGTCELALTGPSGATATATAATNADATTTACELLSVPASSLRGGTWTGTLTYRSARSIGTATVSPIEVP